MLIVGSHTDANVVEGYDWSRYDQESSPKPISVPTEVEPIRLFSG